VIKYLQCPNCGYKNPEGRRYCEECGEKLVHVESAKARARQRSKREAARYRLDAEKKGLDADEAERRQRRSRRHTRPWVGILLLVALIALIVIIVMLTSGGMSAPEKTALDFYSAIKNKDVMSYLEHTDLELYKMAQRGEYDPDPYGLGLEDFYAYRVENLKTQLIKEEGDYAEVEVISGTFEGYYDDGTGNGGVDFSKYPRKLILNKIEGKWLVDDYNQARLPYPPAEVIQEGTEFPEVQESS
jgi:predicted nucleic acid-binding Zn ribbon protein